MGKKKDGMKKGKIGSNIVKGTLKGLGYDVNEERNDEHFKKHENGKIKMKSNVDFLAIDENGNQFLVATKTKAYREDICDTGFNVSKYMKYLEIQQKFPRIKVLVLFVDDVLGKIYGGTLDEIQSYTDYGHPRIEDENGYEIIYFFQPTMEQIIDLKKSQINMLRGITHRKHNYKDMVAV